MNNRFPDGPPEPVTKEPDDDWEYEAWRQKQIDEEFDNEQIR